MRFRFTFGLGLALLVSCDSDKVAGGSTSETSNGFAVRVLDLDGQPAAGVRIRVRPVDYLETEAPASQDVARGILDTLTDDSGFVVLPRQIDRGRVEAFGSMGAAQVALDVGGARSVTLRLAPACRIQGKVNLKPGDGRARIQVRGLEHATWTDTSGFFRLHWLPTGKLKVRAWIPHRAVAVETLQTVPPGGQSDAGIMEPVAESGVWSDSAKIVLNTRSGQGATTSRVDTVPLLVHLLGDDFPASAKPGGADLRVTDSVGNAVPFFVSSWSSQGRIARIWILVSAVRPSDTTQWFRLRWGNPNADAASDPWSVFSARSGWSGVWNLSRTYIDRGGNWRVADATPWSNDGILTGAPSVDLDQGLRFRGTGLEGLAISGSSTNLAESFTVLIRARPESRGAILLGRGDSAWDHGKKWFTLQASGSDRRIQGWNPTFMAWTDTAYNVYSVSNTAVDSGAWTFLAARQSTSDTNVGVEWFVDGAKTATTLSGGTIFEPDRARDSLFVGARHGSKSRFVGSLAEIWILRRAVSDDWIRLQAACREPTGSLVRIRR